MIQQKVQRFLHVVFACFFYVRVYDRLVLVANNVFLFNYI